jgi:hypothetical protein
MQTIVPQPKQAFHASTIGPIAASVSNRFAVSIDDNMEFRIWRSDSFDCDGDLLGTSRETNNGWTSALNVYDEAGSLLWERSAVRPALLAVTSKYWCTPLIPELV